MSRVGRPSLISDDILTQIKAVLSNLRTSGGSISRKTVIAVGNGVLSTDFDKEWWERFANNEMGTQCVEIS